MAKHTFVTESHLAGDEKKTVEILSRAEVATIAAKAAEETAFDLLRKLSLQDRKLVKAVEQAAAASKCAAEAREEVDKIVETARETFREVIEELLAPHYRLLAQHLGIEMPVEKPRRMIRMVKASVSKKPQKKVSGVKKAVPVKKKTAVSTTASRPKRKGGRSCRKE